VLQYLIILPLEHYKAIFTRLLTFSLNANLDFIEPREPSHGLKKKHILAIQLQSASFM
jgi:hypothetical protein